MLMKVNLYLIAIMRVEVPNFPQLILSYHDKNFSLHFKNQVFSAGCKIQLRFLILSINLIKSNTLNNFKMYFGVSQMGHRSSPISAKHNVVIVAGSAPDRVASGLLNHLEIAHRKHPHCRLYCTLNLYSLTPTGVLSAIFSLRLTFSEIQLQRPQYMYLKLVADVFCRTCSKGEPVSQQLLQKLFLEYSPILDGKSHLSCVFKSLRVLYFLEGIM